ncbi:response regulator receiver domain with sensory domain [hydrothermal vent metagenome]|uniref:Response regulator receiver domain with sensory domain n=1 Tax=hydrothermal vent metagenome TaxID=652676 RepID=A0A3B0YV76_9ZZZZ
METANLIQIYSSDLKLGMYVAELDRPWLESPFLFQGFKVTEVEVLEQIQKLCTYVYINTNLGINPSSTNVAHKAPKKIKTPIPEFSNNNKLDSKQVAIEKEISIARQARKDLHMALETVMIDINCGKSIQLSQLKEAVTPMIGSILRNSDASMWLVMMKYKDSYTYTHALNAAVLAAKLGRQLGYAADELKSLTMGALLFDIGKIKLPTELWERPRRLSEAEFAVIKHHVHYGMEIILDTAKKDNIVFNMIAYHHERYNGKGYPHQLKDQQIPLHGRIAAIIDCFDAITTDRPYCKAISPYHAIEKIYEWRDVDFQGALVEQFIQAVGIYPTGTIIELASGDIGIIIAQNPVRRLKPKVMLVLNNNKETYDNYPVLDLLTESKDHEGRDLKIIRAHSPGAFSIDPSNFFL